MKRVVITGMGAITPIGNTLKQYWQNLLKGVSGANKITRFDTSNFKTDFACEIKDYKPEDHFDRKEMRKLDRYSQYAMISAKEAVEDSGIEFDTNRAERYGVIFSSGIGGFETFENQLEEYFERGKIPKFNPFFVPKILADSAAGLISMKYGLMGVNYCPVSACASSTNALIEAFNYVRWGKADVVVTGGAEAPITASSIGGFNSMKALSTNIEDFSAASRPFDPTRDGFVAGEGAATLIVEELEHAKARGAKIYAEIVGGGLSADAYHITSTHPEGLGAKLSMKSAMNEGGISTEQIDYINVHATSTPPGDISEAKAIGSLFESSLDSLAISATKSMTGHLLGAAGAVEAIASVMAVNENKIPPTINTTVIDEQMPAGLNIIVGKAIEKEVNYAMSNTFGFGGHNATALFKKYTA